jgi:hypothetical protein
MVLSSIGYKSVALEGVAFDPARGVVLHRRARLRPIPAVCLLVRSTQ